MHRTKSPKANTRTGGPAAAFTLLAISLPFVGCARNINGAPRLLLANATSFGAASSPAVRDAASRYAPALLARARPQPMSLTAADGSGLLLKTLSARVVVEGPLAFTQLHLTFRNPQNRTREGRFSIALPPRATVARFAMRIGQTWQEAEVVGRQRARQIYESYFRPRPIDPGLLEHVAGNTFGARVFPIFANEEKQIVISYLEVLPSSRRAYRLRLVGLPRIESVDLRAWVGRKQRPRELIELRREGLLPAKDFVIQPEAEAPEALRAGDLAVLRIKPQLPRQPAELRSLLVLFDSSASRALGYPRQVQRLLALVEQLRSRHARARLTIAAFDQSIVQVFDGPVSSVSPKKLRQRLLTRRALGASDLGAALRWAARRRRRFRRLLLISDGIATAGTTSGAELREMVRRLRGRGAFRVDALAVGVSRDEQMLRRLVQGTLAEDGLVLDGSSSAEQLVRRLTQRAFSDLRIAIKGSRWVWPKVVHGLQAGDETVVYAQLDQVPWRSPLSWRVHGATEQQSKIAARSVEPLLLERAVAGARITDYLEHHARAGDRQQRTALKDRIVALSITHRVLSPFTGMLVLENEQEYRRHGMDPAALPPVLAIGPNGLYSLRRQPNQASQLDRRFVQRRLDNKPPGFGTNVAAPRPPAAPATDAPPVERHSTMPSTAVRPPIIDVIEGRDENGSDSGDQRTATAAPGAAAPLERDKPALSGKLARIEALIKAGQRERALVRALRWHTEQPLDLLALVALGRALEANNSHALAARVYGSIIDLYPARAEMRRLAAGRLGALGQIGLALSIDSLQKAIEQRPDQPTGHHLLAIALLQKGAVQRAIRILTQKTGDAVVDHDLEIARAMQGARRARGKPLMLVLTWETFATNVDLIIGDGLGNLTTRDNLEDLSRIAFASNGYGPQAFVFNAPPAEGPYRVFVRYSRQGPMSYTMGRLQLIRYDRRAGLRVEQRPFVLMQPGGVVDLGTFD